MVRSKPSPTPRWVSAVKRRWDLFVAATAALCAGLWVPSAGLKEVSAELITFFGIQSAVLFPAMLLTATILKPDGLSMFDLKRYRTALRLQMTFWSVLLALDFTAVALVIVGRAKLWKFWLELPYFGGHDSSPLMIGVFGFVGGLAMVRTVHVVKGVFSLMNLNSDLVAKAIMATQFAGEAARRETAEPFVAPTNYGRIVEPPKFQ